MTEDDASGAPSRSTREWNARAYHRLSEPQFAWGQRVLDRLTLEGNELVLDAGCGSGRLTQDLAARVEQGFVVGCDLSENMTHAAAETLGKSRNARLVCADLSILPFADAAFDAVFSTATFHWVLDHDRLFGEVHRVIRPGGRLEAQCGGGPNLATVHARADALRLEPIFRDYYRNWRDPWLFASVGETEARLGLVGFKEAHCWLEEEPTPFPTEERYRAFLESVVMRPYLVRLSAPELRARFIDRLVADAASDTPPFTLDYWRLNISAMA
jgi:trans-aconitate 2-methyltransferase